MRNRIVMAAYLSIVAGLLAAGCGKTNESKWENPVLRLAVTTSTRDSGLLDKIVPLFEEQEDVRVDVIANGTGKALKLGENGDVDVVLVHARKLEEAFMEAEHGIRWDEVMFNRFQLLGPEQDPAGIAELAPVEALKKIASSGSTFVSRGDQSGTHQREMEIWEAAGGKPEWNAYVESGQGMGPTLIMADEMGGYTLSDRGTYLAMRDKLGLVPWGARSPLLYNPYGALVVNPEKHPGVNEPLAEVFVDFLISQPIQEIIRDYRVGGETLFRPCHLPRQ